MLCMLLVLDCVLLLKMLLLVIVCEGVGKNNRWCIYSFGAIIRCFPMKHAACLFVVSSLRKWDKLLLFIILNYV